MRDRISMALAMALLGCALDSCDFPLSRGQRKQPCQKGEYIFRVKGETFFSLKAPQKSAVELYPWEVKAQALVPTLTKEYFRCKGNGVNPLKIVHKADAEVPLSDCSGIEEHSLPIREGKEFIYPILIQLLNAIQAQTGRKVVITTGHRCLTHHQYVTAGRGAATSKHLLGAEVAFYVEGFEDRPEEIIAKVQDYFREEASYAGAREYVEFERWDLEKTDVLVAPWYNKEIFIKLYGKDEGRDGDNTHPFPYIGIQVRYDRMKNEKVIYSDEKGVKGCWRK